MTVGEALDSIIEELFEIGREDLAHELENVKGSIYHIDLGDQIIEQAVEE
jgi:hypothetical protein